MRQANVSEKLINKNLAKDVYSDTGRLLLGKGVVLTMNLIDKLIDSEVYFVYIDDVFSDGIEIKGLISDTQMISSVNKVKSILTGVMDKDKSEVAGMIHENDVILVGDIIKDLIEHLESSDDTLYTVVGLMGADMYTYQHSVNVAVLAILTCKSLGYHYEITKHIAMGALLHDIGKAAVKDNLIQKQEKLTELELIEVKEHVNYGYDMIKEEISLSGYTKQIVKLHHEKRDGSGYPLGLKETQIPDFVRIVTICDMFDAMTSNRVYRKRMPAYKAIEILMADSVYRLDPIILQMFLKNICVYPPGSGVQLCDGRVGLVVKYNVFNPTRPIVRMYEDSEGVAGLEQINLEENRILFIEDTVSTEMIQEKYNL